MTIMNYTANHKKWDRTSPLQPNIEVSEGTRPAEQFKPASYLKLVRYDKYYENWFVVQAGKIVALDLAGDVVPAGLAAQATAYQTAFETNTNTETVTGCMAVARAVSGLDLYTADDVAQGVKNYVGTTVVAGEPVVESFFEITSTSVAIRATTGSDAFGDSATLTLVNTISKPIGVAPYNYWTWAGGDGFNPAQFNFHNYNLQHQVAVLCDYYIELPVVLDTDYANAPLTGIAAAVYTSGAPYTPGVFVKADTNSNFCIATGSEGMDILGQVLAVDTDWPRDYLDRVRTAYTQLGTLDRTPGSATGGLPDSIYLAGGSAAKGIVRINLLNR